MDITQVMATYYNVNYLLAITAAISTGCPCLGDIGHHLKSRTSSERLGHECLNSCADICLYIQKLISSSAMEHVLHNELNEGFSPSFNEAAVSMSSVL